MNQLSTQGIILARTNYGEADRIVTMLTPDHGKIRLLARGVRKVRSKLAGGIELFSISDVTYLPGRGGLGTLVSSRLERHFGTVTGQIERVQLGYELIRMLDRATEDEPEQEYFELLGHAFAALDTATVGLPLIRSWFESQLLMLSGHRLNLETDTEGRRLQPDEHYNFDFEQMSFSPHPEASFQAYHIKILRLLYGPHTPQTLQQVGGLGDHLNDLAPLIRSMLTTYVRT